MPLKTARDWDIEKMGWVLATMESSDPFRLLVCTFVWFVLQPLLPDV